jgi:hypothetical protein
MCSQAQQLLTARTRPLDCATLLTWDDARHRPTSRRSEVGNRRQSHTESEELLNQRLLTSLIRRVRSSHGSCVVAERETSEISVCDRIRHRFGVSATSHLLHHSGHYCYMGLSHSQCTKRQNRLDPRTTLPSAPVTPFASRLLKVQGTTNYRATHKRP